MSVRIAAITCDGGCGHVAGSGRKSCMCREKLLTAVSIPARPVNLNSVPDIASKIVNEEPISAKQGKSATEPTAPAPYTGPIVGVTSGKPAPTVGYSWSLE